MRLPLAVTGFGFAGCSDRPSGFSNESLHSRDDARQVIFGDPDLRSSGTSRSGLPDFDGKLVLHGNRLPHVYVSMVKSRDVISERATLHIRFGKRVRETRLRRQLSQMELAEAANLSGKFIGEIERGIANPTLSTIASIADGLSCDLAELVANETGSARVRTLRAPDIARVEKAVRVLHLVFPPRRRTVHGRF